jgi:ribosomal protein S18 acetylase RimI-like enzyme
VAASLWPDQLPTRQVRVARPTDRLDELAAFYRDGLGLPELERFAGHAGYRGVLLGLPGPGHHLEFTQHDAGSPGPAPSRDHLLVLGFDSPGQPRRIAARLADLGHHPVAAENPYWAERGAVTVEDPDGWRVVLVPEPLTAAPAGELFVDRFDGSRSDLRALFELAEDSAGELDSYLHRGIVLVARTRSGTAAEIAGHLQLVDAGRPGEAELKNMAVREDRQGRGIGARLVQAARVRLTADGVRVLHVATAAADIGNLRFYQRQGFRMRSVEPDAFTPTAGYRIDGIPLRDRVWFEMRLR